MSIWNTSHSIGAGFIVILCGYIVSYNWRLGFFVPAALAFAVAIFLKFSLPDLPESVGLPEVEGTESVTVTDSGLVEPDEPFRDSPD